MTYDLGRICPKLRGAYSSSATYDFLDVVSYNGSSYICKADGTSNKVPTNTTYWMLMAQSGESASITPAEIDAIVNQLLESNVVVDSDYSNFKQTVTNAVNGIGNGTLTIKRNGSTLGSFSANQSGNQNINIIVPTQFSDLNGRDDVRMKKTVRDLSEYTDGELNIVIDKLEPNSIYVSKTEMGIMGFKILSLMEPSNPCELGANQRDGSIRIFFQAKVDFDVDVPQGSFIAGGGLHCVQDGYYMLEVFGNWFRLTGFTQVQSS